MVPKTSSAPFSFMSANLLGRERNYRNVAGFGEGNRSIAEFYSPASTYSERIDKLFEDIASMGFTGIDLWLAHCNPRWATSQHLDGLLAASHKHQLTLVSLAGGLHDLQSIEQACKIARGIGCPLLGVGCNILPEEIDHVQRILETQNIDLAFENHPNEPTPQVVRDKIADGRYPNIGCTFDTGWWGTHDYPLAGAWAQLQPYTRLVHLKNIQAPGEHVAARFDQGCLDLQSIVRQIRLSGYSGWISLEYEPLDRDPTEDCREFLQAARRWWHAAD